MSRVFTLMFSFLMVVALTACGGTATPPTPTVAPLATVVPATSPEPVATQTPLPEPTPIPPTATAPATVDVVPDVRGTPVAGPTETLPPTPTQPVRGTPEPMPTEAAVDDSLGLAVPMTLELLKNSEYLLPSISGAPVQLEEGLYENSSDPNMPVVVRLLEEYVAYGDVDGDGLEDAVVPFATTTGGTGVFVDIVVVSGESGTVGQLAATWLGDRVIINTITAVPSLVTVNMIISGPNDPSCCPRTEVTVPYAYADGTLTAGEMINHGTMAPTPEN